jgi:hypothetical protein
MKYNMFSFENRNKVLPITSKKEFILFNPTIHKSKPKATILKPQPKATILKPQPKATIVYPSLLKNKYIDDDGLVKNKMLLTQYSKTLNKNHYSNFFTNK